MHENFVKSETVGHGASDPRRLLALVTPVSAVHCPMRVESC